MANVFLSYSSEDRQRVSVLAHAIEESGLSVFWDRERGMADSTFEEAVAEQLSNADSVVVVWSRQSVGSDMVLRETERAVRYNKIIPIEIDDGVTPPVQFRHIRTANFVGWNGDQNAPPFRQLLQAINARMSEDDPDAASSESPQSRPSMDQSAGEVPGLETPTAPNEDTYSEDPIHEQLKGYLDDSIPNVDRPGIDGSMASPSDASGSSFGHEPHAAGTPFEDQEMLARLPVRENRGTSTELRPPVPLTKSPGGWLGNLFSVFAGSSTARRAESAKPKTDTVDCSVFCPFLVPVVREVLIQVFLHGQGEEEFQRARRAAVMMDPETELRGQKTLELDIARGSKVSVTLSFGSEAVEIDEPTQHVTWRGEPVFCQFVVKLPRNMEGVVLHPTVRLALDGQLVGRIVFSMQAGHKRQGSSRALNGQVAQRYRHAFLSYAEEDRKEVLKRAQALKASKISFFQDVLSLDAGQRWEQELYKNIDKCDLFLLFWSQYAKDSEWVLKEVDYALQRLKESESLAPDIVPILLHGPPPVAPPDSLSAIHFNDPILYHIAAS